MADESGFLAAIAAKPNDDVLRLVYADWLDEQGDDEAIRKATFLRLQNVIVVQTGRGRKTGGFQNRLKKLAGPLPSGWLAVVSRLPIENCPATGNRVALPINPEFAYECPKQWANLDPTEISNVRSCESCRRNVFFCDSIREAQHYAIAGHCVAVNLPLERWPGDLHEYVTMGIMLPPSDEDDPS